MTVSTETSRTEYSGDGTTTIFSYPQYFLAQGDLVVILRDSSGVETVQTITTQYTISGQGDSNGGFVTMVTAPGATDSLIIYNDPAVTSDLDLVENDPLPAEDVEEGFDRGILISQRQKNRLDRAVRLSEGYVATFDPTLPTVITANAVLAIDAAGEGFQMGPTTTEISNAETNASAAAASAAAALVSEGAASTSESNASTSETNASASEAASGVSETNASASEAAAAISETNASASEAAAAISETNASTSETNASTSETNASTSETNASASEANVAFEIVAVESIGSGGTITISTKLNQVRRVKSSGGALVASITPFGAGPHTDGAQVFLEGEDSTNSLEIQYNDAQDGCLLNGNIVLGKGDVLNLRYNLSLRRFFEVGRNK